MKNRGYFIVLLISSTLANACPTCIGRLDRNAPPFFSDERNTYYQEQTEIVEPPVVQAEPPATSPEDAL